MQQLSFIEPGKLEWHDVPEPKLSDPKQALVRPVAVATCDLDTGLVAGQIPLPGPFALGHEFIASVSEVGADVRDFKAGDMVICSFQISCGACERCRAGYTGACSSVRLMSAYGMKPLGGDWGGALSDLVMVPYADAMLVRLPDAIDPVFVASLSDNIPDGWRCVVPYLTAGPADVLIVNAAPSIGLFAAACAIALGARVDFLDNDRRRLEIAEALGANAVEGDFPAKAGRYPITVCATSSEAGLNCALRSTDVEGVCTSVGVFYSPPALPLLEMYSRGITFKTGRVHARAIIPEVLRLVESGKLRPELVTGQVVPWDDAAEALATHTTKTVIQR